MQSKQSSALLLLRPTRRLRRIKCSSRLSMFTRLVLTLWPILRLGGSLKLSGIKWKVGLAQSVELGGFPNQALIRRGLRTLFRLQSGVYFLIIIDLVKNQYLSIRFFIQITFSNSILLGISYGYKTFEGLYTC